MTKKSLVVILVLSIITSIFVPVIAFTLGFNFMSDGFPLKWSTFSFMGSNTNYNALLIDVIFWFLVIWGVSKIVQKTSKKKK